MSWDNNLVAAVTARKGLRGKQKVNFMLVYGRLNGEVAAQWLEYWGTR